MSTTPDVFGTAERDADRLNYKLGVNLDAEDFQTEQRYHRRQLARALAYTQGYGTVSGLKVSIENESGDDNPEKLIIAPGLAIDPIGRLIEVPQAICIRLDRWYQQQNADRLTQALHIFRDPDTGVIADLFVRFAVCERGKTPAFAAGPFDALDAITAERLQDGYEAQLFLRNEAITDAEPLLPTHPELGAIDPIPVSNDRDAIANVIFESWHEGTENWDVNGPRRLPEHQIGQNRTDLFLARLVIPANADIDGELAPIRSDSPVRIYQTERPFALSASILAWLANFPFGPEVSP